MICGPLIINSPTEFTGNSLLSSSTTLLSVSGSGIPILPIFLVPVAGFRLVDGEASDKPKPSPITALVRFSNLLITSIGKGADPQEHIFKQSRPYDSTPGWFTKALYIFGTPGKKVG